MAIADNLQTIINCKNEIRNAIQEKGVVVEENTPLPYYPDKIREIKAGVAEIDVSINNIRFGNSSFYEIPSGFTGFDKLSYPVNMFENCYNLKTVPPMKIIDGYADGMFKGCVNLKGTINLEADINQLRDVFLDCSSVEEISITLFSDYAQSYVGILTRTFKNCIKLKTLILNNFFITPGMEEFEEAFKRCDSLTNIIMNNCTISQDMILGYPLDFSDSPLLTVDSMLNIFNSLEDYGEWGEGSNLKLGETNLAKLTPEQKAIATNKSWILS